MNIRSTAVFALLLVSVVATATGLQHLSWHSIAAVRWDALKPYAVVLAGGMLFTEIGSRWLGIHRIAAGAVVATVIALVAGAAGALLVVVWIGLASYVVGSTALTLWSKRSEVPSTLISVLVGAVVYGALIGLAAHRPVNYPGVYAIALALPVVFGWRQVRTLLLSVLAFARRKSTSSLDLLIVGVALLHFVVGLMPETGHDALASHLFIPAHLASRHAWSFDVSLYVWAVMPMMGDWLFSLGYMLAGETGARLLNVGFVLTTCCLVRELVFWAGGSRAGAKWGALLLLTTPLTLLESSSLYIESVWAAFAVAGALSLFRALQRDGQRPADIRAAAILLGGALAAKAITLAILPGLFIVFLMRFRVWATKASVGLFARALGLFVFVGCVPYLTAWVLTKNPLFPYFNEIFHSKLWPLVNFQDSRWSRGFKWDTLYQVTFHSDAFLESWPGASGFQWMLLLLPAVVLVAGKGRSRALAILLAGAVSAVVTFQSIAYLRYIFPAVVLMVALIATAFSQEDNTSLIEKRVLWVAGSVVILLNLVFLKSATHYGDIVAQPLLSSAGREAFLRERLPIRSAVDVVNKLNLDDAPVAMFSSPLGAGLHSNALHPSWYNLNFERAVSDADTAGAMARAVVLAGGDYLILDAGWGAPTQRRLIEDASDLVIAFAPIAVRRVKDQYRFAQELLRNPGFAAGDGWSLPADIADVRAGSISVNVTTVATQQVPVIAGRRYKNSVKSACGRQPTQGRLQVNWMDAAGHFIGTSIQVFECTADAKTYSMEVRAPRNAATAVVYASGQTDVPVTFSEVSFKQ
ncbi:glycosyl transferase [Variovorax gossypii]|uniref:Glycosyl transferase n=1 Tax=Variovorax gossypii TaxID=1679495 RepID=A0A3S0IDX6_9BURK|nr:glycosyl transferase [Variovorax gossypii]RTQ34432.1 glycosyl transferase [Variovorax gossypii]